MVNNPGKLITQFEVAFLFGRAYSRIASLEKAAKSVSSTGIWPNNPTVFGEEDFLPASGTDRPVSEPEPNMQAVDTNVEIVVENEELQMEL